MIKSSVVVVASILAVVAAVLVCKFNQDQAKKEGFNADGLIFNRPPEWFHKAAYNPSDWIVAYYPDQLAKPECMHYRGDPSELNYLSSAYRFWRM